MKEERLVKPSSNIEDKFSPFPIIKESNVIYLGIEPNQEKRYGYDILHVYRAD